MKVSKVSVSRSAGPPQSGQVVWRQLGSVLIGEPVPEDQLPVVLPENVEFSGTGTAPHLAQ